MATLDNIRAAGERKLSANLAKLDRRHRAMVLAAIEKHGSVEAVPAQVWDEIQRDIDNESAVMLIFLLLAADEWTTREIEKLGIRPGGVTGPQLQDYGGKAADHAQRLSNVLVQSAKDRLAKAQADALEAGENVRKELEKAAKDASSDEAREPAIVTTTTDTISTGQSGAGERANDNAPPGKFIDMIWRTEHDDRVCPICAPLDNTPPDVWGQKFPFGPPAHVNCRCALYPKLQRRERAA